MSKEEIFKVITESTVEIIPELEGTDFKMTDRLVDLGCNSIDRADIVSLTLESLDLRIPRVVLGKANNMGELAEVIYEEMQKQ
nr:acyl carrier protein [uncultured Lachnoclostridium sp.]